MKITFPVFGLAFLAALSITLATWFWMVLHRFTFPYPWWLTLPNGLLHTFSNADLRWIAIQSLALGFLPVGFALYLLGDRAGNGEIPVRGTRLVTDKQLAKRTRIRRRKDTASVQVEMAGVPIPPACEQTHFLLVGSTGTGKSTAINQLLATALERGDRCIVLDPNGSAMEHFGRHDVDVLLNPFDRRGPGWSIFNEIKNPYDYEHLAKSVVPDSADAGSKEWHGYARLLLSETMRAMAQAGVMSTQRLLYWLTQAPAKNLAGLLAGSAASGLFAPGAEKALASTRFILSHHIGPYQYLRPGTFSLKTWLEKRQGNLYITWREDMLSSLKPLISGWVDILTASILTLPEDKPRPLWLILDELASLERLTSLEAGLTKGRKHGLRVVAGLQSVSQLDAIYGHDNAKTLRSCFRNLLALGCSSADPETAKIISEGLGQNKIERTQTTHTQGQAGNTTSKSIQRSTELLVLPSELMGLPPLHGYLKLAGDDVVAKILLLPVDYPVRMRPFLER